MSGRRNVVNERAVERAGTSRGGRSGSGTTRSPEGRLHYPPPAGEAGAHQLVNTSDAGLAYLCFSTMNVPDVTVYPDSNKLGIFDGAAQESRRTNAPSARF